MELTVQLTIVLDLTIYFPDNQLTTFLAKFSLVALWSWNSHNATMDVFISKASTSSHHLSTAELALVYPRFLLCKGPALKESPNPSLG